MACGFLSCAGTREGYGSAAALVGCVRALEYGCGDDRDAVVLVAISSMHSRTSYTYTMTERHESRTCRKLPSL